LQVKDRAELLAKVAEIGGVELKSGNVSKIDSEYVSKVEDLESKASEAAKEFGWESIQYQELDAAIESMLDEGDAAIDDAASVSRKQITEMLSNAGYDAVFVQNDRGSFNRDTDAKIFLNPNQLRSVNAAFDPEQSDSANLLAQSELNQSPIDESSEPEENLYVALFIRLAILKLRIRLIEKLSVNMKLRLADCLIDSLSTVLLS